MNTGAFPGHDHRVAGAAGPAESAPAVARQAAGPQPAAGFLGVGETVGEVLRRDRERATEVAGSLRLAVVRAQQGRDLTPNRLLNDLLGQAENQQLTRPERQLALVAALGSASPLSARVCIGRRRARPPIRACLTP